MVRERIKRIISILLPIIYIIIVLSVSYCIFKINIIPLKFLIIGYVLFILLNIGLFIFIKKKSKLIGYIILSIISIILLIINIYLVNTYKFLLGFHQEYAIINYQVVTLNSASYKELDDLKDKKIGYLSDSKDNIESNLNANINYEAVVSNEFGELQNKLYKKEVEALCIEESYLKLIYEEVPDFKESTKVIYNFDLKIKTYEEAQDINVTKDSFILYISGIDQYGKVTSVRGRSDVNILAVVNPSTNHILLVNTPRDYYVQLDGTTGLKDKLTHAGIYGIEKSIKTLEKFYNINISHYLRVNFDTLIKVVDIIDGIDIYSDKSFTRGNVVVKKGWNHFNGEQALVYSRERKNYASGDNHRGQNQQQVITAIINKVSKSSVIISKYNSILDSLNGSFQTDMSIDTITEFIKYQISKMPSWKIESIQVTGYNSMNYTYSMGSNRLLYVMEPNYKSVNDAKDKIAKVLKEK